MRSDDESTSAGSATELDGADVPDLDEYNEEQAEAFRATYASALEQTDGDVERARELAHAAARGTPGDR